MAKSGGWRDNPDSFLYELFDTLGILGPLHNGPGNKMVYHKHYAGNQRLNNLSDSEREGLENRVAFFKNLRLGMSIGVPLAIAAAAGKYAFNVATNHYDAQDRQRVVERVPTDFAAPEGSPARLNLEAAAQVRQLISAGDQVYMRNLDSVTGGKTLSSDQRMGLSNLAAKTLSALDAEISMLESYGKVTGDFDAAGKTIASGYTLETNRDWHLVPIPYDCGSTVNGVHTPAICYNYIPVFDDWTWKTKVEQENILAGLDGLDAAMKEAASFADGSQRVAPQDSPLTFDDLNFVGEANKIFQSADAVSAGDELNYVAANHYSFRGDGDTVYVDIEPKGPESYQTTHALVGKAETPAAELAKTLDYLRRTRADVAKFGDELGNPDYETYRVGDATARLYHAADVPGKFSPYTRDQRIGLAAMWTVLAAGLAGGATAYAWWGPLNWDEDLPGIADTESEIEGTSR